MKILLKATGGLNATVQLLSPCRDRPFRFYIICILLYSFQNFYFIAFFINYVFYFNF